jgi:hypothetical protein
MGPDRDAEHPLAACHGYMVLAEDGWLGDVETPLFGSDSSEPDYLAVRMRVDGLTRRALVPATLVCRVETGARLIHLAGAIRELTRLPGTLPLAPEVARTRRH